MSHHWIELPFWKGRLSHSSPAKGILLSVLPILIVVFGALKYTNHTNQNISKQDIQITNQARYDLPVIYKYGCDAWYTNADVRPCLIGNPDAPKTVVLLGDSIGAQWFSLLPEIFKEPEWRIIVLTKSSCPLVDEDFFYARIGKIYSVCSDWRNVALDYLSTLRTEIIITGSAATYDFSKEQWIEGSVRVFSRLATIANHIIVVPGTPQLSFDGPSCLEKRQTNTTLKRFLSKDQNCHEELTNKQTIDVAYYLEQAGQRFPKVKQLNLNDIVCPNRHCSAERSNDLVVFRDQQHLTDSFVRAQVPVVRTKLEKLGLDSLLKN